MIRNIIFDMGNVLRSFSPEACVAPYIHDPQDAALVIEVLFGKDWADLDRGTTTYDDVLTRCKARLPERLHGPLSRIMDEWHLQMKTYPEMVDLVRRLKEKGYKLYLLSNASVRFSVYQPEEEVFSYFDGFIVSAFYQVVKPEPEIYQILFDTYRLIPSECFFIDDAPQNVEGGRAMGMPGHVHDGDLKTLMKKMDEMGIEY